jgi:hypothetical protein
MSTETYMTDYGAMSKLTENNYPIWKGKARRVLIAMKAYDIVTGEEPLPVGVGKAVRTQQCEWHKRANDALAFMYLSCSDEILPYISHIDDAAEMWEALKNRLDQAASTIGRMQILQKFTASRLREDETLTQYFTRLLDYRTQLIGTPEEISDSSLRTHIFTTLPEEFALVIKILEHQTPLPTAQQAMDTLLEDEEFHIITSGVSAASCGSNLYSQSSSNRARSQGGRGRGNGRQNEYRCTHCRMDNHTTEECGILKRANGEDGGNGNSRKGGNDEQTCCRQCGLPGHSKPDCIHYKRVKEQRKRVKKRYQL